MGCATLLCLFFHLRVFDDHKDYADDCRHFPRRVLQRGLVTLHELKILGASAIAVELLLACLWSPASLVSVLLAFGFSLLMFKEFFVRDWLKRHFLVYASTHMLIMPLLAIVIFSFATRHYPWQAPGWFWLYSFVGFFVAFNWEISRKIRVPEEEIDGVDSYTKIFGTYGAAYLVLLVRDDRYWTGGSCWIPSPGEPVVLRCVAGVVCRMSDRFLSVPVHTSPRTAKRMGTYAGIYIVAFDLVLAIELGRTYGVTVVGLNG